MVFDAANTRKSLISATQEKDMARVQRYSYSRLYKYENCPKQYRFGYEERAKPLPEQGFSPRRSGTAAHAVAEDLVRGHVRDGKRCALDCEEIPDLLRKHWAKQELPGQAKEFGDALGWLRKWAQSEGLLDYRSVLGIEKKFEIQIGDVPVLGFIDRVDKVDADTVEIIDYKTGVSLFDKSELDHGLQLSIYAIAARELYPWARNVRLVYAMLRHGVRQVAARTPAQLEATRHYIRSLVSVIEASRKANRWPAKLNQNCGYCDFRDRCEEYWAALETVADTGPLLTVDAACKERQAMHALEKMAGRRKREAEAVIKAALKQNQELRAAGSVWTHYNQTFTSYDVQAVLAMLSRVSGLEVGEIATRICKVTKSALSEFVDGLELDRGEAMVLTEELEVLGETKVSPRLHVRNGRKA